MFLERKLLVLFWQCLFSCLLYTSILGNLNDFEPDTDSVSLDKLLPIDKWALMKLDELNDCLLYTSVNRQKTLQRLKDLLSVIFSEL